MARFVMALPSGASEAVRVQRQAALDSAAVQAWHTRSAQAPLPPVPSKSDLARQQTHALQQVGLFQHAWSEHVEFLDVPDEPAPLCGCPPGRRGAAELQGAFVDAGFGRQYAEAGALLRTASDGAAVAAASIHVVADRADTRFQAPSWPRAQRTEGDDSALLRPPTVLPK